MKVSTATASAGNYDKDMIEAGTNGNVEAIQRLAAAGGSVNAADPVITRSYMHSPAALLTATNLLVFGGWGASESNFGHTPTSNALLFLDCD